jgi:hypothetical protein
MSVARCCCGKTKRFRGNRRRFTCPDCRAGRARARAATAVVGGLVVPCSCPTSPARFPGYETREERELLEDDALFRDWKDEGCPEDYPWEANRRVVRAEMRSRRAEA